MNNHKKSSLLVLLLLISTLFITPFIYKLLIYFAPVNIIIDFELNPSYILIFSQLVTFMPFIIIYSIIKKGDTKNCLYIKKLSFKNIILVIGIGIFIQPILIFINKITLIFTENAISNILFNSLRYPLWQIILSGALIPALMEELFFRGIILNNYKNYPLGYGIFISSLFFAIMHLNINQFCYTIFLGLVLAFLVKATGSLWASILCHLTFNGLQFGISYLYVKFPKYINLDYSTLKETIILVISSILFTFFMIIFTRNNKENLEKEKNTPKDKIKIFNIFFIIIIIAFIIYIL